MEQWAEVVKWVPQQSDVFEIGAGTGDFYLHFLKRKVRRYRSNDINPVFVKYLKKMGIEATVADIRTCSFQKAEVYVLLKILYNFKTHAEEILKKILRVTGQRIIILEPVGSCLNPQRLKDKVKGIMVDNGDGPVYDRFSKDELLRLCERVASIEHVGILRGNHVLVVLKGNPDAGDIKD